MKTTTTSLIPLFSSSSVVGLILASLFSATYAQSAVICNTYCDERDSALVSGSTRSPVKVVANFREISLVISDYENMGFAKISNGFVGDKLWLDRTFDGGLTSSEGSRLGEISFSGGISDGLTLMFNIDDDDKKGLGALRACGQTTSDASDYVCTEWARSIVLAGTPIEAAATSLMMYYDGQLWQTVGWWNGANVFTALMHYMKLTGARHYLDIIEQVYIRNLNEWDGNFTSEALDDTEWWAMAWIDAYDLTGEKKYLDMAIFDTDYIYQYVDDVCGGGVWWNIFKDYKNAITNELLIQLCAALHNRIPGDTKYLNQGIELWNWFKQSGMINENGLINDGLRDCKNNGDTTWTYNQGVILGALVELFKATGDANYLQEARYIADAVVNSAVLSPGGILKEPCSGGSCNPGNLGCDCNQISFKGVFMRHIGELNRNLANRPYQSYIDRQVQSNYGNNRNALDQYGVSYAGPFADHSAGTQQSALEAFSAAI